MRRSSFAKTGAILFSLVLVFSACGSDDDGGDATDGGGTTEADGGTTDGTDGGDGGGDGQLVIGRVLPETGPLAFLGPPMIEGVALAIADINEAGGVLGQDVVLATADEGETPQVARDGATRLVGEGANAIIGAAASGNSQEFIQQLFDQQIPQCSGSNTSPAFTDQANAGFYFRTVPPDEAVAPIIADTVIADGAQSVVVVARADDYGQALGDLVVENLTDAGATVEPLVSYDPEAANFNAEVGTIVGADPDAVVLISFDEGGQIVAGLLEQGITADQVYGSDGVFGPTFPALVDENDPSVVDGMTVIGAAGGEEFNERIADATDSNFIYGGQSYDCAIIIALAAEAAGSTNGQDIIDNVAAVTGGGGEKCESFADCKALLEAGEDIDYDGASGPIELDENGDPAQGRYAIGVFTEGLIDIVDSQDVEVG